MRAGVHVFPAMDRVVYGRDFAQAALAEVQRLDARAVLVLASGTLARETDLMTQLRDTLGNRIAGVRTGIRAHTPRDDVVAAANEARAIHADLLITLGGGSLTDAAKMIGLCLGNDVTEPGQLDAFRAQTQPDGTVRRPEVRPPGIRFFAIPTTLSAGEYTWFAGCTDAVRKVKESFGHPMMIPRVVILDPAVTRFTPEWLFLSTGMRAVDHAVETLCSVSPSPFGDAGALQALRLLGRGLPGAKANADDLDARMDCQLGAWLSIAGSQAGVPMGASHAIGHVLGGTAGVPHGYTSCVMMPPVLRFNAQVRGREQALVSEALGRPGVPAANAVGDLVASLGLPQRLRDVNVPRDLLGRIAEESMHDRWLHTNPRPLEGPAAVMEILEAAY